MDIGWCGYAGHSSCFIRAKQCDLALDVLHIPCNRGSSFFRLGLCKANGQSDSSSACAAGHAFSNTSSFV